MSPAQGVEDRWEYAQKYRAGYAEPYTVVSGTSVLRVWVQSGKTYSFRISRVDLTSPLLLRETPVFESATPVTQSSEAERGIWNSYAEFSTAGWPDGLYAVDIGPDGALGAINTRRACALFIVRRNVAANRILYKLPTNTWNAYGLMPWLAISSPDYLGHDADHRSCYGARSQDASWVPYYRPGIGLNGDAIPDWVIGSLPDQHTLLEGHGVFLPWLIAAFGNVDLCTDLDLHLSSATQMLSNYRLLICSGHDEYWSAEMRAHVAEHVSHGRNVAFLSGNNLCWRVEITEIHSAVAPASTLYRMNVANKLVNHDTGNWSRNEAALNGMSYRGNGGWFPNGQPTISYPLNFDSSATYAWIRYGLSSMQLPTNGAKLIGYEFDDVVCDATPPDFSRVATTGAVITACQGLSCNATSSTLSTSLGYFQPYGGVVNVGTTEWIKFAASDPQGVGQVTRNIVQVLAGKRSFISVGRFSRASGFDIVYSNQIELPGESNDSCIAGFWALDSNEATPVVERGKWLSMRQTAAGYPPKAFGRNVDGAPRLYYQGPTGLMSVWIIDITNSGSTTLLQAVVLTGQVLFTSSFSLVGAGLISGGSELDLVLVSGTQVRIQTMTGWAGHEPVGDYTFAYPVANATFAAFGSVPYGGDHASALALRVGSNRLVIYRLSVTGLVLVADVTVSGLGANSQLGGFADLNADGLPEFVVSHDGFAAGISAGVQTGHVLNLSLAALTPLRMKAGYEHDSGQSMPAYCNQ